MNKQTTTVTPSGSVPPPAPHRYTAGLAGEIETRWQDYWEREDTFRTASPGEPGFDGAAGRFYCLDMFPYPSGSGLHVGHPEGYTASDIICRYQRHRGRHVLHPMGWDAFGLPAEQYAIQTGVHPTITTRKAIDTFRRQLKRFGFSYDWSREFATIDPQYYRWTQWIWLKAYHAWYDPKADAARPIAALVEGLEYGRWRAGEDDTVVDGKTGGGSRAWSELDTAAQRRFIDGQRLAYLGEQTVNWCPKLGTALANEEVIDGKSERGGHPVLRKPLKQWMFRITAFADRLLRGLDEMDWPESTKTMQREWIGRSEGAEIDFPLCGLRSAAVTDIRVYTTRPDTVFGATYMVLAPEHPLVTAILDDPRPETDVPRVRAYVEEASNRGDVERMADSREKTGVWTGFNAINPANGERIPIWIADYVLMGYGHGAIMAVPAHDGRDFDFARTFDLPIVQVIEPAEGVYDPEAAYAGPGINVNSANDDVSIDGLDGPAAMSTIIAWLEEDEIGRHKVNFKLRDWLFSRQRYWGEPFPIVYDEHGDHYAVGEASLPVELPEMADYEPVESDEPAPLLAKATDWIETTAGAAGVPADVLPPDAPVRRESNTMPGWAGSCWYYLRYCDPHNQERFVSREAETYWLGGDESDGNTAPGGVDLYIGGAEHAVLHLLYARFWHKILFDLGEVSTPEPISKLFHQGMITSHAYQRADKTLVPIDEVDEKDGVYRETATGDTVEPVVAKMSKSLKNVVNPDEIIAEYGADTFRLYEMYMGPLEASKPWNTRDMIGLFRFLQRAWRLLVNEDTGETVVGDAPVDAVVGGPDDEVEKSLHRAIAKVGEDIERLAFNTAIAAMIEFVNVASRAGGATADQLSRFAIILSPFTPHLAEEMWARLGHAPTITKAPWPTFDPALLRDDTIEMPVQIMGKVKARVSVPADADKDTIEKLALADERVQALLEGKTVRKVIVVPGKIVNIIAG